MHPNSRLDQAISRDAQALNHFQSLVRAMFRLQLDTLPIEYREFESEPAKIQALVLENATHST